MVMEKERNYMSVAEQTCMERGPVNRDQMIRCVSNGDGLERPSQSATRMRVIKGRAATIRT
jgi:hypothetical protein